MLVMVMSVINTGGVIRGGRGRGVVLAVISTGDAITTVLADIFFPTPSIVAFRVFTVSFLMSVATAVAVLITKSVALERAAIMATFLVHTLLVEGTRIFGVEGRFWRESWESMDASDESLSSDSSLDK